MSSDRNNHAISDAICALQWFQKQTQNTEFIAAAAVECSFIWLNIKSDVFVKRKPGNVSQWQSIHLSVLLTFLPPFTLQPRVLYCFYLCFYPASCFWTLEFWFPPLVWLQSPLAHFPVDLLSPNPPGFSCFMCITLLSLSIISLAFKGQALFAVCLLYHVYFCLVFS